MSEELAGLVRALHSSVCLLSPVSMTRVWMIKVDVKVLAVDFHDAVVFPPQEIRPDGGLVLDVVLLLWNKVKEVMQGDELQNPSFTYCVEKIDNFDKVCLEIAQTDHFIVNYFCIV